MSKENKPIRFYNDDYAIFLPSISSLYSKMVSKGDEGLKRKVPESIGSIESLNFLNEKDGAYYYPYALYSAGHAELNIEKSDVVESMVQKRNREKTIIVGDSGGYQIATGVIKLDWNNQKEIDETCIKILRWLEHTSDYSMILDMPVGAIAHPKATTINNFEQCIEFTEHNIKTMIKHRVPGATKLLNVLQGRNWKENDYWYERLREYNHPDKYGDRALEGWAFAGNPIRDLYSALRILVKMRDNDELKHIDWLHFLGIGKLHAALAYTDLEKIIKQYNPKFKISFDAASPFVSVAKGGVYTDYIISGSGKASGKGTTKSDVFGKKMMESGLFSPKNDDNKIDETVVNELIKQMNNRGQLVHPQMKMPDSKLLVGSTEPWPFTNSPFAENLTLGDICCSDNPKFKSSWDGMSYGLLMAHSTYLHVKSVQQANYIYSLHGRGDERLDRFVEQFIPTNIFALREIMKMVFESETPYSVLEEFKDQLQSFVDPRGIWKKKDLRKNTLFDVKTKDDSTCDVDEVIGEYYNVEDDNSFSKKMDI